MPTKVLAPSFVETIPAVNFCNFIRQVVKTGAKPPKSRPLAKTIPHDVKAAIIADKATGTSALTLAKKYKVGYKQVLGLLSRWNSERTLERKPGSGRPRKTTPAQDRKILLDVKRCSKLTGEDIRKLGAIEDISEKTVRRRITESGEFGSYWQVHKPYINKKNREIRVKWAKEHLNWTVDQWRKVLWSDESPFVLRFHQRRRIWRRHHDRYNVDGLMATVKHDVKIMVWGAFSANGVGRLYLVVGILNKEGYNEILRTQMLPSAEDLFGENPYIFQQDNDPKHTARINKQWLVDNNITTFAWPSQSPDLNPIENLWSILDSRLKNRAPNTAAELFQTLTQGWYSLERELLTRLVDSMPDRCAAVIKSNGFPTKY